MDFFRALLFFSIFSFFFAFSTTVLDKNCDELRNIYQKANHDDLPDELKKAEAKKMDRRQFYDLMEQELDKNIDDFKKLQNNPILNFNKISEGEPKHAIALLKHIIAKASERSNFSQKLRIAALTRRKYMLECRGINKPHSMSDHGHEDADFLLMRMLPKIEESLQKINQFRDEAKYLRWQKQHEQRIAFLEQQVLEGNDINSSLSANIGEEEDQEQDQDDTPENVGSLIETMSRLNDEIDGTYVKQQLDAFSSNDSSLAVGANEFFSACGFCAEELEEILAKSPTQRLRLVMKKITMIQNQHQRFENAEKERRAKIQTQKEKMKKDWEALDLEYQRLRQERGAAVLSYTDRIEKFLQTMFTQGKIRFGLLPVGPSGSLMSLVDNANGVWVFWILHLMQEDSGKVIEKVRSTSHKATPMSNTTGSDTVCSIDSTHVESEKNQNPYNCNLFVATGLAFSSIDPNTGQKYIGKFGNPSNVSPQEESWLIHADYLGVQSSEISSSAVNFMQSNVEKNKIAKEKAQSLAEELMNHLHSKKSFRYAKCNQCLKRQIKEVRNCVNCKESRKNIMANIFDSQILQSGNLQQPLFARSWDWTQFEHDGVDDALTLKRSQLSMSWDDQNKELLIRDRIEAQQLFQTLVFRANAHKGKQFEFPRHHMNAQYRSDEEEICFADAWKRIEFASSSGRLDMDHLRHLYLQQLRRDMYRSGKKSARGMKPINQHQKCLLRQMNSTQMDLEILEGGAFNSNASAKYQKADTWFDLSDVAGLGFGIHNGLGIIVPAKEILK